MSDIEKIHILHDLRNNFVVKDDTIQELINQISNAKHREDIHRFFRGYTTEDKFKYLFASLPWVRQVNSLGQQQFPKESKEKYQVPDYSILYETAKHEDRQILFEVKSVTGDKQSLELIAKQIHALRNYAASTKNNFLFAIYWEKYQSWTVNTVQNFKKMKKKYKIDLPSAMQNDMSVILGDLTFLIDKTIYRKSLMDQTLKDRSDLPRHEKYGGILKNHVSIDDMASWQEITSLEASIIDAFIDMAEIKVEKDGDKTTLIEKSKHQFHGPRLSMLILRHLALFNLDLKSSINGLSNPLISRKFIIEFMKKLSFRTTYMIPAERTATSDRLFEEAFDGTWLLNDYKAAPIKSSETRNNQPVHSDAPEGGA